MNVTVLVPDRRLSPKRQCGMSTRANRIKDLRKVRKLTQQALADRLGCSRETVSRLESSTGGMQLDEQWIYRIADALDVEPGDLLLNRSERARVKARDPVPEIDPADLAYSDADFMLDVRDALAQVYQEEAIRLPDRVLLEEAYNLADSMKHRSARKSERLRMLQDYMDSYRSMLRVHRSRLLDNAASAQSKTS